MKELEEELGCELRVWKANSCLVRSAKAHRKVAAVCVLPCSLSQTFVALSICGSFKGVRVPGLLHGSGVAASFGRAAFWRRASVSSNINWNL